MVLLCRADLSHGKRASSHRARTAGIAHSGHCPSRTRTVQFGKLSFVPAPLPGVEIEADSRSDMMSGERGCIPSCSISVVPAAVAGVLSRVPVYFETGQDGTTRPRPHEFRTARSRTVASHERSRLRGP